MNQSNNMQKKTEENEEPIEIIKETYEVDVSQLKSPVGTTHKWFQVGYDIVCNSCEITHGSHIGKDYILTGIDEKGMPILKKR